MQNIYRINSKLYFSLYNIGIEKNVDGDKLIAVYSILKKKSEHHSKYYSFVSKNNKKVSGYSLLRNKTNISLHTLNKYVPLLIELGICFFDVNGNFILLGTDKLKENFKSKKILPIVLEKNVIKTAYNSYYVRIHSSAKKQEKQIEKKHIQRELLKRKDNPRSLKELRQIKKILKKGKLDGYFIDKCVLSVNGFSFLKSNEDNNKSKGSYWKSKMLKLKLISTKRRFETINKMSFNEYKNLKNNSVFKNNVKFLNGLVVKELVSELNVLSV